MNVSQSFSGANTVLFGTTIPGAPEVPAGANAEDDMVCESFEVVG